MKTDELQKIVEELVRALGVGFKSVTVAAHDSSLHAVIETDESGILIGQHGSTFNALSHLIRKIAAQKLGEEHTVTVDVNDYRAKATEELRRESSILFERAKSLKANVEMRPMSSYERMLVHSFASDQKEIKTESAGVGPNRHVVIKYVGESDLLI